MAENFRTQILNNKEASSMQAPVRTLGSCTFMYLRHNDVYILALTRNNANVMLAFKFMTSVSKLSCESQRIQVQSLLKLGLLTQCRADVHAELGLA